MAAATELPPEAVPDAVVLTSAASGVKGDIAMGVLWVATCLFVGISQSWHPALTVAAIGVLVLGTAGKVRRRGEIRLVIDDRHVWYGRGTWRAPVALDRIRSVTWRDSNAGPSVVLRSSYPDRDVIRKTVIPVNDFDRASIRDALARWIAQRPDIEMNPLTRQRLGLAD